jgi:hypothetical protein
MTLDDESWSDLLTSIAEKKCTPFIGPEAHVPWIPSNKDIAIKWAEQFKYPLDDPEQLDRVAQFLEIYAHQQDEPYPELYPKTTLIKHYIKKAMENPPDFSKHEYVNNPYVVLNDLNLPIYITTNYDHFMEMALKSKGGKEPVSEFCRWYDKLNKHAKMKGIISVFDQSDIYKQYKPSHSNPLVYHLHGDFEIPQSMILTDSEYIDFVINLSKEGDQSILPAEITKALATDSLLFVGYNINEANFRITLQSVMRLMTVEKEKPSIAVQIRRSELPEGINGTVQDDDKQDQKQLEAAETYIKKYTKTKYKVRVYWGDMEEFFIDLRNRWEKFRK